LTDAQATDQTATASSPWAVYHIEGTPAKLVGIVDNAVSPYPLSCRLSPTPDIRSGGHRAGKFVGMVPRIQFWLA